MTDSESDSSEIISIAYRSRLPKPGFFLIFLLLTGCSTLPDNLEKSKSWSYPSPENMDEASPYRTELNNHPNKSGVLLLHSGLDAFAGRLAMVSAAKSTIDSQYYLDPLHNRVEHF